GRRVDGAQRAELRLAETLDGAAAKRVAGVVVVFPREKDATRLARRDEEQTERGIERWRHPVRSAGLIRTDLGTLVARHAVGQQHRPAVGANLLRPARLDERFPSD